MHNSGKVFSTQSRRPFKLIYIESYLNKHDAALREKFLKSGWGEKLFATCIKKLQKVWRINDSF